MNDKLAQEVPDKNGDKDESSGLGRCAFYIIMVIIRPVELAPTNETTEPVLENVNEALLVAPRIKFYVINLFN